MGHLLMENQSGLIVDAMLTPATGTAERAAAEAMLAGQTGRHRATLGADKGYDAADFVAAVRALNVTPAYRAEHLAPLGDRRPDHAPPRLRAQPTDPQADRGSLRLDQDHRRLRKTRHRGTARVGWLFTLTAAACNLVRLPKLLEAA